MENIKNIPKKPGVYFFKDKSGKVIYVGKASILKNRVSQYFQSKSKLSPRIQKLVENIFDVEFLICESEIDALIQEAHYIKKYNPKYNVLMRDDKNYSFVGITKEYFPRIFITHQPAKLKADYIGPFTESFALKETLKMLRKTFPYRHCIKLPKKPCLQYHLGRCLAPCVYPETKAKVKKNIKYIKQILKGERTALLKKLEREMKEFAKKEKFEKAGELKKQVENIKKIFAHKYTLEKFKNIKRDAIDWKKAEAYIQNFLNIKNSISRVEAFDISNISGKYAVGSMVVFTDGLPDKKEYRKFKIKFSGDEPNDPKMMQEVLKRRLKRKDWPEPDLIILDGGITQLNAVKSIADKKYLIISLAKKEEEIYTPKNPMPQPTKNMPEEIKFFFQQIRNEAHRFAITYHRKLRSKGFLK
ncbi:excinuclease ABC subunit UvrC [Candidatus Azambacteria bacterium]|nr:excinuclease ABC subunit UvrC [Candidatus Azambacteria bacterium]